MVAFKGADLTEISEQIQKVFNLYKIREYFFLNRTEEDLKGKLTWEVSKTSSFASSCDDCCGRWPLRAEVWIYEPNASPRCIYTRWSLSSHQRQSCRAGSCATGRAEWSSNGMSNLLVEAQIKISGEDVFDVSHYLKCDRMIFFFFSLFRTYRTLISCFVILID